MGKRRRVLSHVVTKTAAGQMLDEKSRDQNHKDNDSKHTHPTRRADRAACTDGGTLLTAAERSQSLRFEHRQRRSDEQHDDGRDRVGYELDTHTVKISSARCRSRDHVRHSARNLHVNQQEDAGKNRYQQFRHNPIMPEQAP